MVLNISFPDLTREELIELVKELDKKNDELNFNVAKAAQKHILYAAGYTLAK